MSFDPYGPIQPPRQPGDQPPGHQPAPSQIPPDGTPPVQVDVNALNAGGQPDQAARNKVMLPGTFLIVLGVLNLLMFLYTAFNAVMLMRVPDAQLEEQVRASMDALKKAFPQMAEAFDKAGADMNAAQIRSQQNLYNGISLTLLLLGTVLLILGGARMIQLRSYALAMMASVFAIIPCISVPGCCCGLGQVVGIWGAIVLMGDEVRRSFR